VIGRCLPDRGSALREMEDCWPFGIVLWGMVSNHHVLRWLKTVVVSDVEKASVRRQVGIRETTAARGVEILKMASEPGCVPEPGIESGGCPCIGQAVSGIEAA
jgi:hypothetical protein